MSTYKVASEWRVAAHGVGTALEMHVLVSLPVETAHGAVGALDLSEQTLRLVLVPLPQLHLLGTALHVHHVPLPLLGLGGGVSHAVAAVDRQGGDLVPDGAVRDEVS